MATGERKPSALPRVLIMVGVLGLAAATLTKAFRHDESAAALEGGATALEASTDAGRDASDPRFHVLNPDSSVEVQLVVSDLALLDEEARDRVRTRLWLLYRSPKRTASSLGDAINTLAEDAPTARFWVAYVSDERSGPLLVSYAKGAFESVTSGKRLDAHDGGDDDDKAAGQVLALFAKLPTKEANPLLRSEWQNGMLTHAPPPTAAMIEQYVDEETKIDVELLPSRTARASLVKAASDGGTSSAFTNCWERARKSVLAVQSAGDLPDAGGRADETLSLYVPPAIAAEIEAKALSLATTESAVVEKALVACAKR